ncbi:ABC transporter permease [Rossellomorea aquimaris]|uniref:ABC transporter permease n=1 Tax=Rossellomorea aquimaris TaxID=189382 RepID=UPI001CD4DE37|nr:ABC transporter permease [Rossellomorea aquimaris]MCA1055052.1 ABC transporter permease [Rossellomorea aquimaris]
MRRLLEEWRYQWGVVKSVLDWTIVVYLVIPLVIAAPFLYVDMWQYSQLYWNAAIPYPVLLVLILSLSASGNIRTFLKEADLLYLLQKKEILHPFKRYGFLYSVAGSVAVAGVAILVLLPLFKGIYGLAAMELFSLLFLVVAFRLLFFTVKKFTSRVLVKSVMFVFLVLASVSLAATGPIASGLISLCVIGFLILFHLKQVTKANRWFTKELEIERRERVRYIRLILTYSMEVEKSSFNQRNSPLLFFKHSQRLFKKGRSREDGLLDLLMKGFLRGSYMKLYIQMTLVTTSAIIVFPVWVKWLVFVGFVLFLRSWLKSLYGKMLDAPFFAVVPYDEATAESVWPRFKRILVVPAVGLTGVLVVVLSFVVWVG